MLCSAIGLWVRTKIRLRYRRKAATWHKTHTWRFWRTWIFRPNVENYNAELCIAGPWGLRALVKVLPGKPGRHRAFHTRALERALGRFHRRWVLWPAMAQAWWLLRPAWWPYYWRMLRMCTLLPFARYRAFKYIVHKMRNIAEQGGIHHLCEATSRKVQLCMVGYMASIHAERYTPFPDLALSDFENNDIYYRVFSDFLSRDPWVKIKRHIEQITGMPMLIEYAKDRPGVIRVHPLGQLRHTAKVVPRVGTIEHPTKWVLGKAIAGEKGAEIATDIRQLINRTHFLGLGVTGSGKTNAVGLTLDTVGRMVQSNKWVEKAYFLDPSGGAGLDEYAQNVNFAITMPDIHRAIREIAEEHRRRERLLPALRRSSWPIGETIDGVGYGAVVIVFDEAQQFLNDKEEIGGMLPGEILSKWSRELRKYGMVMIIYTQAARANQGVPIALTQNCFMRQCFAHKDEDMATTFFNCGANAFDVAPWEMRPGEFVLLLPGQHEFVYGKTDLAPHEIKQQKLRVERGW